MAPPIAQPVPDSLALASAEQLTECMCAHPRTLMTVSAPGVSYDVPCSWMSVVYQIPPRQEDPPFDLTDEEKTALAGNWAALTDGARVAWYRAAVSGAMWGTWNLTQTASFRYILFAQFGTTVDTASAVQTAIIDAIEQAPRAAAAAQVLVNNTTVRSTPDLRQRIINLAELAAMGQDDTLMPIVQGFRSDVPAGE